MTTLELSAVISTVLFVGAVGVWAYFGGFPDEY